MLYFAFLHVTEEAVVWKWCPAIFEEGIFMATNLTGLQPIRDGTWSVSENPHTIPGLKNVIQ
jgi:hypothetical protein